MVTTLQELQATTLLLCAGVVIGLLYDVLRVFRMALGAKTALCMIMDVVFWPAAFVILFYFSYLSTAGDFRLLSLVLIFCGAAVYFAGASKLVMRLAGPMRRLIIKLLRTKIFKYLFK